jgi:hypothetical protein
LAIEKENHRNEQSHIYRFSIREELDLFLGRPCTAKEKGLWR